jgi:hypothetical protein
LQPPPITYVTDTVSWGERVWRTSSTVKPKASVSLICDESGWRTYMIGAPATNPQPSSFTRKATKVTADVSVPYANFNGLQKKATEQWCPTAIASDIWKVPAAERNKHRTVKLAKTWPVRITGQCIRTKVPFIGKIEKVSASKSLPVEVRCSYYPSEALKNNEPLKLWWNGPRQDNFTSRSAAGDKAAKAAKYGLVRTEARTLIFHAGGSHSLDLYWNPTTTDNLSTTPFFKAPAGYTRVRNQGYVYASPKSYTVPLKLYWSAARKDYMTTATAKGEGAAKAAGYTLVKVIGHAIPQALPK